MTLSPDEFRSTLARWASGVTVVTTAYQGVPHGMTVSSFASLSLSPPLISVALEETARTLEACRRSGVFAVNILAADQDQLSNHFASRAEADRFRGQELRFGESGCPMLPGVVAYLECSVFAMHAAGDHELVIGQVQRVQRDGPAPLLYYSGAYGTFNPRA